MVLVEKMAVRLFGYSSVVIRLCPLSQNQAEEYERKKKIVKDTSKHTADLSAIEENIIKTGYGGISTASPRKGERLTISTQMSLHIHHGI